MTRFIRPGVVFFVAANVNGSGWQECLSRVNKK